MRRILKNPLRQTIQTSFRGRTYLFKSKEGKLFNMDDEEEEKLYHHWAQTYQFLYDVTANHPKVNGGESHADEKIT